ASAARPRRSTATTHLPPRAGERTLNDAGMRDCGCASRLAGARCALTDFWRNPRDAEMPSRAWFKASSKGAFNNLAELSGPSTASTTCDETKYLYLFTIASARPAIARDRLRVIEDRSQLLASVL